MPFDPGAGPRLISCIGVESDLALLPHFLGHYADLGIRADRMHLILQSAEPDHPALDAARDVLGRFGVTPHEVWIAPYTSDGMWQKRREVQASVAAEGDWILSADADEFHEYPEPLPDFLDRCAALGVTCTQGVFIDRLAPGGALAQIGPSPALSAQFPVMADVISRVGGTGRHHNRYGTVKLMAIRSHVMPSRGGHHPLGGQAGVVHLFGRPLAEFSRIETPAFRFRVPLRVHHYHWSAGLAASLERRLATPGVSAAGQEYGAKILAHLKEHGGVDLDHVATTRSEISRWPLRLAAMRMESRVRLQARRVRHRLSRVRP